MDDFFENIDDVQIEQPEEPEKFVPNCTLTIRTKKLHFVDSVLSKRLSGYVFFDKSDIKYRKEIVMNYKTDGSSLITIDVSSEFKSSRDANDFLDLFLIDEDSEIKIGIYSSDLCVNYDIEFFDNPKMDINTLLENRCHLLLCLCQSAHKPYDNYLILKKNIHLINGNICSFLNCIYKNSDEEYSLIKDWSYKKRHSFVNLKNMLYKVNDFHINVKLYATVCYTYDHFYDSYEIQYDSWFVEGKFAHSGRTIRNDSYLEGMTYMYYDPFRGYVGIMVSNIEKLSSKSNTIHHGFLLRNKNSVLVFTGLVYDYNKTYLTAVEFNGREEDVQNTLKYLLNE